MATAKQEVRKTVKLVEQLTEDRVITLTLDLEEAATLMHVVDRIGGSPFLSARKHTDSIAAALYRAGVKPSPVGAARGSIHFASP